MPLNQRMAKSRTKNGATPVGAVTAPQVTGDTTAAAPDREQVATRAYELYLARGGGDGLALDDWLNAERELTRSGERKIKNQKRK